MKILCVDYISAPGHMNFNKIHINAFLKLGHELHLVGKSGQFSNIKESDSVFIYSIPDKCYKMGTIPSLSFRLQGICALLWVKKNFNISKFDYVIFLTYDVLSLVLYRFNNRVILINHNNVDQLDSSIKLFLTKQLPSYYIHVALNEYMQEHLCLLLPNRKVLYVPHGYLEPATTSKRPSFIDNNDRFIFCPVNRNVDIGLIQDLLESNSFKNYLVDNGILLFVKSQLFGKSEGNIRTIEMLSESDYNYMLCNAMAVFLPYGDEFKYRCSGILFECFSRNTPVLSTSRAALLIYKDRINIHFCCNTSTAINALRTIQREGKTFEYDKKQFQPLDYWKSILR